VLVMRHAQADADSVFGEIIERICRHGGKVLWLSRVTLESQGMEPRLSINRSYLAGDSAGLLLPSVAQPPFPLQEFLPLQLLSAVLQPPLPLHEFMPLQACLSVASLSLSPILSETPAFELVWTACAVTANEPLIKPAIAAPAIIVFLVMLTFLFLCWFLAQLPNGTTPSGARQRVKNT
jgi:hypothetical protein